MKTLRLTCMFLLPLILVGGLYLLYGLGMSYMTVGYGLHPAICGVLGVSMGVGVVLAFQCFGHSCD